MAVSQADVDALYAALASGEKQVVLDGQSITYRTISEIEAAIDRLETKLKTDAGVRPRPKQYGLYITHGGRHRG